MKLVLSLFVNDPAEEDADDVGWCSHVGHEIKLTTTIVGITDKVACIRLLLTLEMIVAGIK